MFGQNYSYSLLLKVQCFLYLCYFCVCLFKKKSYFFSIRVLSGFFNARAEFSLFSTVSCFFFPSQHFLHPLKQDPFKTTLVMFPSKENKSYLMTNKNKLIRTQNHFFLKKYQEICGKYHRPRGSLNIFLIFFSYNYVTMHCYGL